MKDLDFKKLPIINAINEYLKEDIAAFSMPGHKYSKGFLKENLKDILLRGDITEVEGLDNLHSPEGIIKESEQLLAKTYKSEESYFLVNGSTSGNLIMIFAAFNEGDKIIVERNCHRSIMNGIILRKLTPIYVENIIDDNLKCPITINEKHLNELLEQEKDIKGIVLTYPYYHGLGLNTERIINRCKNKGLKVLVDSAHGAHFGFHDKLPKSIQDFNVDIAIMSAHKTLPSLTQTAYIHVNNKSLIEKVKFYKGMFLSTSPSYMFMMSLEYSRYYLDYEAKEYYDKLFKNIEKLKDELEKVEEIKIIDKLYFKEYDEVHFDESRILINLKEGYSAHKLLDYLREETIQCEMSDERNLILIPSPFNSDEEFDRLIEKLINCDYSKFQSIEKGFYKAKLPRLILKPYEAIEMESEIISLEKASGRVVAENIIPYPPGVPLLIMGEQIEESHISIINKCLEDNVTVIGAENKVIKVIKAMK
ncbi:MAG: aminotransferase class I/II-fold pyridoxal phosphate-dependent enzyme [Sarcina sp.]